MSLNLSDVASLSLGPPDLLPIRGKVCCEFLSPLKFIASAEFEPASLESSAKHTHHHTTEATTLPSGSIWKQYVCRRRWYLPTSLQGVTARQTNIDIFTPREPQIAYVSIFTFYRPILIRRFFLLTLKSLHVSFLLL
jgi:hypothetical protein